MCTCRYLVHNSEKGEPLYGDKIRGLFSGACRRCGRHGDYGRETSLITRSYSRNIGIILIVLQRCSQKSTRPSPRSRPPRMPRCGPMPLDHTIGPIVLLLHSAQRYGLQTAMNWNVWREGNHLRWVLRNGPHNRSSHGRVELSRHDRYLRAARKRPCWRAAGA